MKKKTKYTRINVKFIQKRNKKKYKEIKQKHFREKMKRISMT